MFYLSRLTEKDLFVDIPETDFKGVIFHMVRNSGLRGKNKIFDKVIQRESLATTAIGNNVAIPHCRLNNSSGIHVKLAIFRQTAAYSGPTEDKINFVFLVVGSQTDQHYYVRTMAHIVRFMQYPGVRERLLGAGNKKEIQRIIDECESEMLSGKAVVWT